MFMQTFEEKGEKCAVIEGTLSSIRALHTKRNRLYAEARIAVSPREMSIFMKQHFTLSGGALWASVRFYGEEAEEFLDMDVVGKKCHVIFTGVLRTHTSETNGNIYLNITVKRFKMLDKPKM